MDAITFKVCGPAKPGSIVGIKCKYCGDNLNCSGCDEKVLCLGRGYINFCSNRCSHAYHERLLKMKKLRSYFWDHPFRSIAMAGMALTLSTGYIAAFAYLKTLPAIGATGILIALTAGLAAWIHGDGR